MEVGGDQHRDMMRRLNRSCSSSRYGHGRWSRRFGRLADSKLPRREARHLAPNNLPNHSNSSALFRGDAWDSISRKFLKTAPPPNEHRATATSSNNDNSSDHNDIRVDFGATWQIRYTAIHGRLRISGRLYELRPFAMRACVGRTLWRRPHAPSRAARGRGISRKKHRSA